MCGDLTGPADVTAHPEGASPFGVADMVGNAWQWTDEVMDPHTRSGILRAGTLGFRCVMDAE